jgi:predicted amidophosphoribosyltransferase
MLNKKRTQLLGICGVYCGACPTYRAYNDNDQTLFNWIVKRGMPPDQIFCKGCGSDVLNEWCANCVFKRCTNKKEVAYCFECKDFPCKKLIDFSKTRPHRTLGLNNLKRFKKINIEKWLKQQEKRWMCSKCGKKLHWYSEECPNCGTPFVNATQEAASLSKTI